MTKYERFKFIFLLFSHADIKLQIRIIENKDIDIIFIVELFATIQVKNFIPSISAVTGPEPQRYLWRLCIGLHATPRYVVGIMYYNYYLSRVSLVPRAKRSRFQALAKTTLWTYIVENSCLLLVSIIANYENYRELLSSVCASIVYIRV